jgi:uncharacterized protein YggE
MIRIGLLAGTAALALALPAAAQDARPMAVADGTVLEVMAEGSSTRVPDVAAIQAGVTTQAATAVEAMAQNRTRMNAVLAALRRAGVAERDIQSSHISLNPQYRFEQNQAPILTGYQASNEVSVRFRDIARSGAILDALVGEGANNLSGPNLSIDKPQAALDEARTAALAAARARAELYARAAGLRVDRILWISEGQAAPPMPMMMMRAAAPSAPEAPSPVAAGEQELRVSLSARFLLK